VNPVAPFNATAGNTAGDTLNLDLSASYANPSATAIVSTVSGTAQTTGYKTIGFSDIEAINLIDGGLLTRVQMGDLYIRGSQAADIIQFGLTATPGVANTRVNSSVQSLAVTTKTIVFGRGGNDTVMQGNLNKPAEFYGEGGDDYLAGYNFNDLLVGGDGSDRLLGGEGANELWGDNLGEQTLVTGGNDIMSGGSGADKFYGGGGNDQITAAGGVDYAFGGFGDDSIDGGDGNDRLYGGEGSDTISGAGGHDLVAGNGGNDKLYGKLGNDVLIGGLGADILFGEEDNDLLFDGQVSVSSPAGNDASTLASDANDQAMAALLTDWSTDSLLTLLLTSLHDTSIDSLGGMSGTDTASPGPGDTGDWENTLP
jgi:Ca2+-binding RTX toxin-like protein